MFIFILYVSVGAAIGSIVCTLLCSQHRRQADDAVSLANSREKNCRELLQKERSASNKQREDLKSGAGRIKQLQSALQQSEAREVELRRTLQFAQKAAKQLCEGL